MTEQSAISHASSKASNTPVFGSEPDSTELQTLSTPLQTLISTSIQELDIQVVSLHQLQSELYHEVERLSAELQLFLSACDPPDLTPAYARLSNLRKQLLNIQTTLKVVADRMERLLVEAAKS